MASAASGVVPFRSDAEIEDAIPRAIEHLNVDGVLAHPTETVYGLGCRLTDSALARLRALKGRGYDKPFVVLVGDVSALEPLGVRLGGASAALADAFWPGPLTMVVRSSHQLPGGVQREDGAIAVRWTSHTGLARMLRALGAPMTSTSANRAGLPAAGSAPEIVREWRDELDRRRLLVLDGGPAAAGTRPSTIVDCTTAEPSILRQGAIARGDVLAVVQHEGGDD